MRLSYRERFRVYWNADREGSPEDWVMVAEGLLANVVALSTRDALAKAELYKPGVTHRGRCNYHEKLRDRYDAALLVSEDTGRQYLVIHQEEGPRLRAAHGELVMDLHEVNPPYTYLRLT